MKRVFSSFLLALFVNCSLAFSAQLPSKCSVYKPQELLSEVLKESAANKLMSSGTFGQKSKPSKMMYWDVFSDRDDNITYADADGKTPFGKLDFNDKVRIAKISGQYAMVFTEPNETVNYPEISGSAVFKGWIPMSNLLLWSSCLANDRGIYFKALLCVNADQRDAKTFGVGYRSPNDKSKTVRLSTDMQFYYVMKRGTDGMVLLATQHKIDGLKGLISNKLLKAWVPNESYVPWNQRSCIEPTWEHEDVEYFASRGISSKIYDSKELTGDVASLVPFRKSTEPYEQYQYRMAPEALRFPILDGTTADEYECSSFTSSGGSANVSTKQQEAVKLEQRKKQELEKLLHLNLAIVIDGTSSMDPYFPAVEKAIKDGCAFFDKNKFKIKVGVLIYRDYADGTQGLTEICNLTSPNDPALFSFLSSGGNYGIKSSANDRSFTEALYYGINEALDKFHFDKDQSNLMLVVGDCGNALEDPKGPTADQIVSKLVAKNVNLFGFQVRNLNQEAWNLYNRQLLQIMKKSLQKKYEIFQQSDDLLKKSTIRLSDGVRAKTTSDGQRFSNISIKDSDQKYFGEHKYATAGTEISAQVFADLMKESIGGYAKSVQSQLDLLVNSDVNDLSDEVLNDFEGSDDVLKAATVNVNKAWLRKRLGSAMPKGSSQLITFRGWTAKKDESGRDFYKPVLFISSEEYDELMMRLKPVDDVARQSTSDNRQPYVNALKALLKSMIPGITNEEMERKGIADVMNMIAGLNESSDALKGRTLLEISDEAAVKPTEYRRMVMDFDRKYKNLDFIKNNPYKYVREFNGVKYYWIPIENLP
ncbi:MAG TPA: hypothetical protein DD383_00550 [Rikenellaceae bacterium]|nr:hypothetical protein [Rikenellaceae bacterium]